MHEGEAEVSLPTPNIFPSPPPLLSIIQGACSRNFSPPPTPNPRVLVIYLGSSSSRRLAGDRPSPPPSPHPVPGAVFISSLQHAGLALLQAAPDVRGSAGHCRLSGDPKISFLGAPANPLIICGPWSSILLGPSFPTEEVTGDVKRKRQPLDPSTQSSH